MKNIIIFMWLLLILTLPAFSQKYFTRSGHISFHSNTPLENIDANNDQVTCFIDLATGDVAYAVLMKSFEFKKALMQDHFNENYVESTKFPKATYRGKILDSNKIFLGKNGVFEVIVEGELTLHGVTKPLKTKGTLEVAGSKVIARTSFVVVPEDYNIKVPSLVRDKIEKSIDVKVETACDPYKK